MPDFHARLKLPKPTLWLGCVVDSITPRISRAGSAYAVVRFSNCPLVHNVYEHWANGVRRAMDERSLQGEVLRVGDVVHLDVRWREAPHSTRRRPIVYPRTEINLTHLLASREREAALVDVGRF